MSRHSLLYTDEVELGIAVGPNAGDVEMVEAVYELVYEWSGRYVPATRIDPPEYPDCELQAAVLVSLDGRDPTAAEAAEFDMNRRIERLPDLWTLIQRAIENEPIEVNEPDWDAIREERRERALGWC
jgi:hypothetical protein